MSRSNNVEAPNPAKRFLEWDGTNGGFEYYDRDAVNDKGEKGKRCRMELPVFFMTLDCLSTIVGFSDADNSGIFSNEVRDVTKGIFNVRTKKGVLSKGGYYDVMADPRCVGAKYAQSVYAAMPLPDPENPEKMKLQIVNFKFSGAALSAWIDFRKKNNVFKDGISIQDVTPGQKGTVKYVIPNFITVPVKPESDETCKALDKEIMQPYFKVYFNRGAASEVSVVPTNDSVEPPPMVAPSHEDFARGVDDALTPEKSSTAPATKPLDDLPF